MTKIFWRISGVLIAGLGISLLLGAISVTVLGGVELVLSSGYLLVPLVTALALMMTMAGFRLALSGKTDQSLVAPWALITAGWLMLVVSLGMLIFAVLEHRTPHAFGTAVFALLGVHWLRSGLHERAARRTLHLWR